MSWGVVASSWDGFRRGLSSFVDAWVTTVFACMGDLLRVRLAVHHFQLLWQCVSVCGAVVEVEEIVFLAGWLFPKTADGLLWDAGD